MTTATTRIYRSPNGTLVAWDPPTDSQLGQAARSMLAGAIAGLVMLIPGAWMIHSDHADRQAALSARAERMKAHERLVAAGPSEVLPVSSAAHGRDVFVSTCAACHKADGTGVPGLGRDLTTSWFVASLGDDDLHRFVTNGRPALHFENTTRIAMPPKGGRPELTDADVSDVVTYIRGLQDPRRLPALPAPVAVAIAPPTEAEKAVALAAAGGDAELAEYIAHGTKLYANTCIACHGRDGKGMTGLGKDLINSEFVKSLDDDGLLAFVKKGRNPGDPLNTTKTDMPPKGGNPALSDDDLLDIISYVRSLQKQASATP